MDSDESQQPAVGEPTGQQLKRAREKLGLTLENIAEAQHLRPSIIQFIEDGDYEQINSELFLKGYVRGYAKQVGVNADELIETLDLELEPLREKRERQAEENPLVDIERKRIKKRRIAKVLLICALIAGLGFIAWKVVIGPRLDAVQETDSAGESDVSVGDVVVEESTEVNVESDELPATSSSVVSEESLNGGPDSTAINGVSGQDGGLPEDSAVIDSETVTVSPQDMSDIDVEAEPEIDTLAPEGVDQTNAPDTTVTGQSAAEEVQPSQTEAPTVAEPLAVEPAATARLTMVFGADCWVQVTDSTGRTLVSSLQRAGDRVDVSGEAPLNVVIGAVDAVDVVTFAGEPVELSSFRVINNRTEFTLTL